MRPELFFSRILVLLPLPPRRNGRENAKVSYFYTIFRGISLNICRMIQKFHGPRVFLDKSGNFEYSL